MWSRDINTDIINITHFRPCHADIARCRGQKDKLLRALETMHSAEDVNTVRRLGDIFVALCKELVHTTKALVSGTIAHLVAHDPLTAYM